MYVTTLGLRDNLAKVRP